MEKVLSVPMLEGQYKCIISQVISASFGDAHDFTHF